MDAMSTGVWCEYLIQFWGSITSQDLPPLNPISDTKNVNSNNIIPIYFTSKSKFIWECPEELSLEICDYDVPQGSPGFPCGSADKESACNAGDRGLIPGLARSPGEGKGYRIQYSGLKNSMDCIDHGVTKSRTWLSDFHSLTHGGIQRTRQGNLLSTGKEKSWEGL